MVKPSQPLQRRKPNLKPMDLMATTAHELKSPLVLISGLANMLKAGQFGELTSRQVRYIARIDNASERLLTMVENLLIINRSQHNKISLSFEAVAIGQTLEGVIKELQPRLRQKKMRIAQPRWDNAPPVLADPQLLHQVLYNLLDNSLKYSPPSTTVTIKWRLSGQWLKLQIDDQGFGIKPKDLDRLFERFGSFQKPINTQGSSSGLGLYIVKNLLGILNGQIKAKRLSRGTRFTISLPTILQLELFPTDGTIPEKEQADGR